MSQIIFKKCKFYQDLYMESEVKTHKRKSKHLVDPGDLVSEKSLQKSYNILGQVRKIKKIQGTEYDF